MSKLGSVIGAVIGCVLVLASYWLNGFDFNERGQEAAGCFSVTCCAALAGGAFGAFIGSLWE